MFLPFFMPSGYDNQKEHIKKTKNTHHEISLSVLSQRNTFLGSESLHPNFAA